MSFVKLLLTLGFVLFVDGSWWQLPLSLLREPLPPVAGVEEDNNQKLIPRYIAPEVVIEHKHKYDFRRVGIKKEPVAVIDSQYKTPLQRSDRRIGPKSQARFVARKML